MRLLPAEPARQGVQRWRPQRRDLRRHEQVGEVELVAAAADAERVGVRQRDPEVGRGDDQGEHVARAAEEQAAQQPRAAGSARQQQARAPSAKAPPSVAQKSVSRNVANTPSVQSAKSTVKRRPESAPRR